MARKATDVKEPTYVTTLSLCTSTKAVLAAIRHNNTSEAARYLIRYAIEHGALLPYMNADGTLKAPPAKPIKSRKKPALVSPQPVDIDAFKDW